MDSPAATWIKRAEIDTRPPFRSVREAVSLFGNRVLLGEIFNPNLKQTQDHHHHHHEDGVNTTHSDPPPSPTAGDITAELEETKQSLEKAKEEGLLMANCISDLKQELERTKQELHHLKTLDYSSGSSPSSTEVKHSTEDINDHSDDIKFVVKKTTETSSDGDGRVEFQKKRFVTFANPPSLAQATVPESEREASVLQRHPSLKKKKKKPLIPLIGGIFSRNKKVESDVVSSRFHRLQLTPPRVRK